MVNKFLFLIAITCVFFFTQCAEKKAQVASSVIPVSNEFGRLTDTALFSRSRVIALKGVLLTDINRLIMHQDKFYVFDKQQNSVVIFNDQGDAVQVIRRLGRANGEYIGLRDFTIDPQTNRLILYADKPYKLLYFDEEGRYLHETDLERLYMNVSQWDGELYGLHPQSDATLEDVQLLSVLDSTGKTDRFVPRKNNCPMGIGVMGNRLVYTAALHFTDYFDHTVYSVKDKAIYPKYELDFGENNLPGTYLTNKVISAGDFDRECSENNYVYDVVDIIEVDDYLFFKTNLVGFYMFSKKTNQCKRYHDLRLVRENVYLSQYLPVETSGDKIAFVLSVGNLLAYQDLRKEGAIEANPLLDRLSLENKDFENPVLFLFDFK